MTHSCALLAGVRSKGAYKVLIGKIDLFNKIYCIGMHIASAFLYLAVLPYSLLRYYVFNLGADSFYLFVPSWFVCHQMTGWIENNENSANFLLHWTKVPIRLENTIWIFDGLVRSMCRSFNWRQYLYTISKSSIRNMLAFHLHRWRHYNGSRCIQRRR